MVVLFNFEGSFVVSPQPWTVACLRKTREEYIVGIYAITPTQLLETLTLYALPKLKGYLP